MPPVFCLIFLWPAEFRIRKKRIFNKKLIFILNNKIGGKYYFFKTAGDMPTNNNRNPKQLFKLLSGKTIIFYLQKKVFKLK